MPHTPFTAPNGDTDWPSVSEIGNVLAKPNLYKYYADKGWDKAIQNMEEAGTIGTMFHAEIYHRLNGSVNPDPVTPQVIGMVDKFFTDFIKPYKVQAESLEKKVWSEEYRTHGTYDAIITVTDLPIGRARTKYSGRVLADWKQSSGIYDTHGIQLGGYWLCTPNAPIDGLVIQVNRDTLTMNKKLFPDLRWYAEVFKAQRDTWDFVHRKGVWER